MIISTLIDAIQSNWFDLIQTAGIIASLAFSLHASKKEREARQISNLTAIKENYIHIWDTLFIRPDLERVLAPRVDLERNPITPAESLFVTQLIIHLDSVHRAMKKGLFVTIEGLGQDIRTFFSAPIARAVWQELRSRQNREFVQFVENFLE